jgi:hypothetical protein
VAENPYDPMVDELALTRLTDPLAEFIKLACGTIQIKMIMAFTKVPPLDLGSLDQVEAKEEFRSCLTPTVCYAYEETDSWIRSISRSHYSIRHIHPQKQRDLFVCAAKFCGQIIRKSMTQNPSRGVVATRHSMREYQREMNTITNELIVLMQNVMKEKFGIILPKYSLATTIHG